MEGTKVKAEKLFPISLKNGEKVFRRNDTEQEPGDLLKSKHQFLEDGV